MKRIPFVPDGAEDCDRWPPFPFPNLGYFEPPGWDKTDQDWFVDKTGHGAENEPALTAHQFRERLRQYVTDNPGHGFAITEEGEFQAVVSAFRREIQGVCSKIAAHEIDLPRCHSRAPVAATRADRRA